MSPKSTEPARRSGARAGLAGVALAGALAVCATGALAAGTDATATGPGSIRGGVPTAAEVRGWERDFLSREGSAEIPPASKAAAPVTAPKRGRRSLFPQNRVLSLYGAAGGFGVLGRKSVKGAARKLRKQMRPYRKRSGKAIIGGFDLVAVIATSCSGPRDNCRARVSKSIIRRYLNKIRAMDGRLILDIQPGRSSVLKEIEHLAPFIRKSNVDVAIDAEWNMQGNEEPGQDQGSISAKKLNRASAKIQRIASHQDLPDKLLIVHQFRKGSIKNDGDVRKRGKVDVTFNFDGIGSPSAKRAGYRNLKTNRLFNGFSLFYKLDTNLMGPKAVLGLNPSPNYVMYQ